MEQIGIIGYGLASFGFFIFILLLLAARNNTFGGKLILLFAISSLISSVVATFQLYVTFSLRAVFYAELIKALVVVLLLTTSYHNVSSIRQWLSIKSNRLFLLIYVSVLGFIWITSSFQVSSTNYTFLVFLSLNLWVLILLEQLYRNSNIQEKWAFWPLIIAFGVTFVFDFIMFSQASLVNSLDFNYWYVRGYIHALSIPFLLVTTKRVKNWSVNVFVSRNVVFYSSMLSICGIYLLIMAAAGYFIRYIGGQWGTVISIAFLVLGIAVLVMLLITERLRREVKVFITKHFFANKYDYRFEWLKMIEQLEKSDNTSFYETSVKIICSTLQTEQGALVKVSENNSLSVKFESGINAKATFSDLTNIVPFCIEREWIIDLTEYQKIEGAYGDLDIDADTFVQNLVGIIIPIYTNHRLTGFFLSPSKDDGRILNWEDRDLLSAISKQLSHYISLHETQIALSESKQFDAFNRMSAFLVHDLKNIQAQLALINANAKRHKNNPEFVDDAFDTVSSATDRLEKVLQQLRNKQIAESKTKQVNVTDLLEKVLETRNQSKPMVSFSPEEEITIALDEEKFSSIINHLIQNAQEATSEDGWVKLTVSLFEEQLHLDISDNGCGMSEEFIAKRLFKPFDTTKGNAGMGIGVYEAKQYIESLHGKIQVVSFENKGTSFQLIIPAK